MLFTHEKQVSRLIRGTLHLIERKKPNSRIGIAFVKTSLPYVIHKNEYGGYWILNREYKPLSIPAMLGTGEPQVRYQDYQCQLECTTEMEEQYGEQFHFYTGSQLTTAEGWKTYLNHLDNLIELLENYTTSVEFLKRKLLGLDQQVIQLDGHVGKRKS